MTDIDQFQDLARSVKKGDYPQGRTLHFLVPRYDFDFSPMPYDLPPSPVTRDAWLRASVRYEAMWACAVGITLTQLASAAYEIESSVPLRADRAHELLSHADSAHPGGGGWVPFIQRTGRDFLTTNNGVFMELERYTGARGARIKAVHHLDSARCRRTGDPEIPVVYMSLDGREHEMKYWQVLHFADMSDPAADKLGQGMCAAHRAWRSICLLAAMERYVFEKVSGRRPLKIYLVGGMAPKQLEDLQKEGEIQADQKGTMVYMGAVVSGVPTTEGLTVVEIPLAEIPDGFNAQEERQEASILYSDALGIDPQDLRPLTGQALGTGAQSVVLDDKAKGKGIQVFKKHLAHALNEVVLDAETTFIFIESDYRDKKAKADIDKVLVDTGDVLIASGTITPQQNLQVMVDSGVLPKEFLPVDQTTNVNIGDDEKPEVGAIAGQMGTPNALPAPILDANGMPTTAQPAGAQTPVALNGAQVTAALGIVSQVAAGNIPRETGINSLITFFALTQEQAERVMGSAGQGFTPDAEAPPVKMPASGGGNGSASPADEEEEQQPKKRIKELIEEAAEQAEKHLGGKHNQKRHGWRYGYGREDATRDRLEQQGDSRERAVYESRAERRQRPRLREGLSYGKDYGRSDLKAGQEIYYRGDSRRGSFSGTIKKVNRTTIDVISSSKYKTEYRVRIDEIDGLFINEGNKVHVLQLDWETMKEGSSPVTPRGSVLPPLPPEDAITVTLPRLEERAKAVWDATMEQVAELLDAEEE